jgi:hypothetical protein
VTGTGTPEQNPPKAQHFVVTEDQFWRRGETAASFDLVAGVTLVGGSADKYLNLMLVNMG